MRIFGFPVATFVYNFLIPLGIIGFMFFYCWHVEKHDKK